MYWMNFAVRAGFSWPNVQVEIPFENSLVVLSPQTTELACTASIYSSEGFEFDDGATQLAKFLSCLAWSMRGGIEEHFAIGSNNPEKPGLLGNGAYATSVWASVEPWRQLYLPLLPTPKASLAIALFREGMTLNSVSFAFLSFYKVLGSVFVDGSAEQLNWINASLSSIHDMMACQRLVELQAMHQDVGKYLYGQGRCAVAHAFSSTADPDDYIDRRRLREDLPLIQSLAEICIERELAVLTTDSFLEKYRNAAKLPQEYLVPVKSGNGRIRYQPLM